MKEGFIPTIGIVTFKDNQVLLVKHTQESEHLTGVFGIPAGQKRKGELLKETAIRKFWVETGFITNKEDLVRIPGVYYAELPRKSGSQRFSLRSFLCRKFKGDLTDTEVEKPEWVSLLDLSKIALLPNMDEIIRKALKLQEALVG